MNPQSQKIKELKYIRNSLKNIYETMNQIHEQMIEDENNFEIIENNYNNYKEEIHKGNNHINNLKKFEYYETLFLYFGFYFFFGCVFYVLYKRFPIHRIKLFLINSMISYFSSL